MSVAVPSVGVLRCAGTIGLNAADLCPTSVYWGKADMARTCQPIRENRRERRPGVEVALEKIQNVALRDPTTRLWHAFTPGEQVKPLTSKNPSSKSRARVAASH